ncbi:MAG: hypothetical protein QXL94_06430, partial [Candidatus Parvarchaeum sp.]
LQSTTFQRRPHGVFSARRGTENSQKPMRKSGRSTWRSAFITEYFSEFFPSTQSGVWVLMSKPKTKREVKKGMQQEIEEGITEEEVVQQIEVLPVGMKVRKVAIELPQQGVD